MQVLRERIEILLLIFTVSATTLGCGQRRQQPPTMIKLTGSTMGTSYTVKISSRLPDNATEKALRADVQAVLDRIDQLMSTYRSDSEVSRFNAFEGQTWFEVSPETLEVARHASAVYSQTEGAFDPTVGAMVNLWGFGPGENKRAIPDDKKIEEARKTVGYDRVEFRSSPAAMRKKDEDCTVDFSAIAKGFAVDQIAQHLTRAGIDDFMVEVGGEMRVQGTKPGGEDWVIGIEAPLERTRRVQWSGALRNASLATSGDYRNYFVVDDKKYSHTIDPRTGRPTAHCLGSVSVIEETCVQADAIATALMVMGPDEGYEFATRHDIAALFLIREARGITEKLTPKFRRLTGITDEGR